MPRWTDRFRLRLRSLFQRRAADAELAREIALHLDEHTHELIGRGMAPAAARAAAQRAFGPTTAVEERCRDTRRVALLQNLGQDLRQAWRSLRTQPLLILAATASVGVGVGANTLVFNLASELLLAAPTTRAPHEVMHIRLSHNSHVSYRQWRELDESGALAGLAGYNVETAINWHDGTRTTTIVPLIVTANFFDLLGVPVAIGRGFTTREADANREPRVAVVSHAFWQRRLGADPQRLGRSLIVNGEAYTLLGVLPAGVRAFPGFGLAPEIYLPQSRAVTPDIDEEYGAANQLLGRLRPGQSLEQGLAALNTVLQRQPRGERRPDQVTTFAPLTDGTPDLRDERTFFLLLLIVVGLVLTIACANVAGLLLARAAVRRREIAVRVALGATRARLVQQLLAESFWLASIGTAAGLALMFALMMAIARIPLPLPLPLELRAPFDARLFGYALGLVLLATLVGGLLPALQATRPSLAPALKQETAHYGHRRWTLRALLVGGQVAISMVLLVTAFLFLRNLARTHTASPGFEPSHVWVGLVSFVEGRHTPEGRAALLQTAVERVAALPGMAHASYALGAPLTVRNGRTAGAPIPIEGEGDGSTFEAHWSENMVGPDYFATLGVPLVRGRDFTTRDTQGTPNVIVVNEEFVRRYLGSRPPLGLRLLLPGATKPEPSEIVGVAANSKYRTLGEAPMAAIYQAYLQHPGGNRVAHVFARTTAGVDASSAAIEGAIGSLDPTAAVDVRTMREALAFAFLPSRVGAVLLGGLGALALTLAAAGLFAMLSYAVTRRTREIGVRMALGASTGSVARLIARDAVVLVGCGMAVGVTLAAFVTKPLALFLVTGLSARDPISFVGTALLFALVSAAATWIPARRAMRVEPTIALRND